MQEETYAWFAFFGSQVLIEKQAGGWHIPCGTEPPVAVPEGNTVHEIGTLGGHPARAFALSEPVAGGEDGPRMMKDLRASFDVLPFEEYARIAKRCPQCGQEIYPRISPAIIVLIKRGEDEVLLVHARNFRGTFRGLVAGFLEPGETLEECVRREVMEETGLAIKNIRYFASQPWPYPSGIMVGYVAEYAGGDIHLQDEELNAGAFYHKDRLPEIPKKLSIARRLIDAWLEGKI